MWVILSTLAVNLDLVTNLEILPIDEGGDSHEMIAFCVSDKDKNSEFIRFATGTSEHLKKIMRLLFEKITEGKIKVIMTDLIEETKGVK